MRGVIVVSKFWTNFFSAGRALAVTIFPFIFVRSLEARKDTRLLNHERIHICQVLELCIVPFYLWYALEFLFFYLRYRDVQKAYMSISFEREAYAHEKDLTYLARRQYWAFVAHYRKP
ncbi:hypothetical protein [Sphingobacterium griseoflavum]|uniref:DUF4157 domain-containing protein n=1 Tax=Sphingobacterium griseoflavum TaxID=1474952 RepID=A0ABQ3HU70_9SPHI|nr:hypothetical protein [Sphingobacterium griseoflavum]GHE23737.1 hypothetical protein GCM10017764_07050 [Sphingobacterium griseoflavum]